MDILRLWRILPALLIMAPGCSGGGDEAASEAPAAEEAAPATEAEEGFDAPVKIDIKAVRDTARTAMFVPAPTEFQAALKATGVDIDFSKLVKDSSRGLEGKSRSIIALESGVRMADVLFTAQGGNQADTLRRMKATRESLAALQIPGEVMGEVDGLIGEVEAGNLSSAELSPSLDVLAERIQDNLNKVNDPNTATLVQAGGWLQGANKLAGALASGGHGGEAASLLRQPTVLAHFKDFLNKAGAGDPNVDTVLAEMTKLETLAAKPELNADDMKQVASITDTILSKF